MPVVSEVGVEGQERWRLGRATKRLAPETLNKGDRAASAGGPGRVLAAESEKMRKVVRLRIVKRYAEG